MVGLTHKSSHLAVSDRFELSLFSEKFDYMFALSVFTHLFANHTRCLAKAREVLAPEVDFLRLFWRRTACTSPRLFISPEE